MARMSMDAFYYYDEEGNRLDISVNEAGAVNYYSHGETVQVSNEHLGIIKRVQDLAFDIAQANKLTNRPKPGQVGFSTESKDA